MVAVGTSLGSSPRRKRAATEANSFVESVRKRLSSSSGAVTRKPWSWLAARVLALIAERRAARKALIISTRSSAPWPRAQTPAQMVDGYRHVEVEVRVHAQDHRDPRLRPFGTDRRHVPIRFRSRVRLTTRGAEENGRYCEGSLHRWRAPMRSRRCSVPGWPAGKTNVSGRRVTPKAPLGPTWKEGQAGPRCRPQPFSRILTAWNRYSRTLRQTL